jgi:hypothetical protein
MVTVVPLTVQTLGVELAKVTSEPEVSEPALREKVPAPPTTQVCIPGALHVMVWAKPTIVMVRVFEVNEPPVL